MERDNLTLGIFIGIVTLLAFTFGTFVGEAHTIRTMRPMIKHDVEVGVRSGFVIGCRSAFGAALRLSEGDVLEPMYYEWCMKNAMKFDAKVSMKKDGQ